MLAGRKDNTDYKLTLNNCTIKIDTSNDGIHSGKNCGGFIGYAVKTDLIKCNAQDVKIFGRFDTGGLIGYAQECSITGRGSVEETNKSVVTLDSLVQRPAQCARSLQRLGDHRDKQVWYVVVYRELDLFRVNKYKLHLVRRCVIKYAQNNGVCKHRQRVNTSSYV